MTLRPAQNVDHVMFLSTVSLRKPKQQGMATAAVSEKIRSLATSLQGTLSDDAVARIRSQFLSYAEELESELIDNTLNVSLYPYH